jgi:hypothetical protein
METLCISHQAHLTFPEHFLLHIDPATISEIVFEDCQNFKINLERSTWQNIQRIIIRNGKYIELKISIPSSCQLQSILFENTEFAHLKEVSKICLQFHEIIGRNSNYLKISGPFLKENALPLTTMTFEKCNNLELFKKECVLPHLAQLTFHNCNFLALDLSQAQLPEFSHLQLEHCEYFRLKKTTNTFPNMKELDMDRCNYAQLSDFSQFPNLKQIQVIESQWVQIPKKMFESSIFHYKESKILDPIEIKEKIASYSQIRAQKSTSTQTIIEKICPYCARLNRIDAEFCIDCNASLYIK